MGELISPSQSEAGVLVAAIIIALVAFVWGFRLLGARGLIAGVVGPLIFGGWQFHKWITRYDPRTEYFGLDKVKVLALEAVVFVAFGLALGIVTGKIFKPRINVNERK